MNEEERMKIVYGEARSLLKKEIGNKKFKEFIDHQKTFKKTHPKDVFKIMIGIYRGVQGYKNVIAPPDEMKDILMGFNAYELHKNFKEDWKKLFFEFKKQFGSKDKFDIKFDINNEKKVWVKYSKNVLACAKFMNSFKSTKEFDEFVKRFQYNEYTRAALPMLLEKEIFGFGFALACDFLKDIGYLEYAKPDRHLKKIFIELDLAKNNLDYEVFKQIIKMSKTVKQEPKVIDKIFYGIGSGNILPTLKIKSKEKEFIKNTREKLKIKNTT